MAVFPAIISRSWVRDFPVLMQGLASLGQCGHIRKNVGGALSIYDEYSIISTFFCWHNFYNMAPMYWIADTLRCILTIKARQLEKGEKQIILCLKDDVPANISVPHPWRDKLQQEIGKYIQIRGEYFYTQNRLFCQSTMNTGRIHDRLKTWFFYVPKK